MLILYEFAIAHYVLKPLSPGCACHVGVYFCISHSRLPIEIFQDVILFILK